MAKNFPEHKGLNLSQVNKDILQKWTDENLFHQSLENRKGHPTYVFFEGPPSANGHPGIHHVLARTIKDSVLRYKTMKGYNVPRKAGWDTHGLPVELSVEKELGITKEAIGKTISVEEYNSHCRADVMKYTAEWRDLSERMGYWVDLDHPYITYENSYIETLWWLLKQLYNKGLLYKGYTIQPYSPAAGTGLSSHELNQPGCYRDVKDTTVTAQFKIKTPRQEMTEWGTPYFIAWTTTPWTLPSNTALCVGPKIDYVCVQTYNSYTDEKISIVMAEALVGSYLNPAGAEKDLSDYKHGDKVIPYRIVGHYKGSDLIGMEYDQLMPYVNPGKGAFRVIGGDYVSTEDGTGIVHIAPAYGEDDNRVCQENGITFINPVGKDGCYLEGPWKGRLVTDSDLELDIIKWLKENDKLFKKIKIVHDYPHCWRCHSPLIYFAKPAWYVNNTSLKDKIIEENNKINWYPSYVGEKRFSNWLSNMIDWGISRNRFWGCPMPLWTCDCGHIECIGSIKELKEKNIDDIDIDSMELHRPYIDNVHIKCPSCGKAMTRVKDVMDVWFDSGVMPYAQFHYPFENKELFDSQFPADFIAEGVDQTRGWFYVLLVISTIISGKSSFKNVVVNDMMLDANGKKMSKSIGNIIDPVKIMSEYGADTVRWYMLYASPVWTPLKFDVNGLKEVYSKFFNPLKNTYLFFATYANIDNVDPKTFKVEYKDIEEIDKWLLSKYNKLIKDVTSFYDEFDLNKVVKAITTFVSEDLSNWYIRRNRDRFWGSNLDNSKKSVYQTTYEVLTGLCKLIAPVAPYISEEIYKDLTGEESVHLSDFPVCDEKLIDIKLEEKMDLVRDLISLGRNAREVAKIKVRQPISEIVLDGKVEDIIGNLQELIKEELNVKEIHFEEDLSKYMNFIIKPNFKEAGKLFGPRMKDYTNFLNNLSNEDYNKIINHETIKFEEFDIDDNLVDIRIESKEGFDVASEGNNFIILNTTLTDDLIKEGIARELVSKVQNLRKEKDFDIADRINLFYNGDSYFEEVLSDYNDYIKKETLSLDIIKKEDLSIDVELNDIKVYLDVERR